MSFYIQVVFAVLALFIAWKLSFRIIRGIYYCIFYRFQYKDRVIISIFEKQNKYSRLKYGDCHKWRREHRRNHPNAEFVLVKLFSSPILEINDPKLAQEMLNQNFNYYQRNEEAFYQQDKLFSKGLLFTDGAKWKLQRQLLANVFKFDELADRVNPMKEICEQQMHIIREQVQKQKKLKVRIIQQIKKITQGVIIKTFFSDNLLKRLPESQHNLVNTAISKTLEVSQNKFYYLKSMIFGSKIANYLFQTKAEKDSLLQINLLRELGSQIIEERIEKFKIEKSAKYKDFLDFLVQAFLEQSQEQLLSKNCITKEEILHQFVTFYFAGSDTTANLAAKMIYFLPLHPEIYAKVQSEIDQHVNDFQSINLKLLKSLQYCDAYIKEILRYSPPVSYTLIKIAKQNHYAGDVYIPKGMSVKLDIHSIMRNQKFFTDPDIFKPERWLEKLTDSQMNINAFVPFSLGQGNCIGQHMAQIEAKLILIYYLKNFKITFNHETKIVMQNKVFYQPNNDELIFLELKD